MSPMAACPMCGYLTEGQTTAGGATTCARCGAVLEVFDSTLNAPAAPANSTNALTKHRVKTAEWSEFVRAVVPKSLLAAAICAIGGAGIAVLLAPVLGEHLRIGIFGGAYFGGQVGLVFGFLWFGLAHLDAQMVGGALLGFVIGLVVGLINVIALSRTSYLPDVTLLEGLLIGVIAGPVTGIFLAMLRADG